GGRTVLGGNRFEDVGRGQRAVPAGPPPVEPRQGEFPPESRQGRSASADEETARLRGELRHLLQREELGFAEISRFSYGKGAGDIGPDRVEQADDILTVHLDLACEV